MMRALDLGVCTCFIATFAGVLVFLIQCLRYLIRTTLGRPSVFPKSAIALFVMPGILVFALFQGLASLVYQQVNRFILRPNGSYAVWINGGVADSSGAVLSALRNIDTSAFQAHHSHPTVRIAVRIESGGQRLDLELGRDSENHREYWVFYPTLFSTDQNAIARLRTGVLDMY
jgi:hypothetical protein